MRRRSGRVSRKAEEVTDSDRQASKLCGKQCAPTTVPFASQMLRDIHFRKHGADVGAADAENYEQMAEEFMFGVIDLHTRQCTRPNHGARLRFRPWNRRFGAADSVAPENLRTFYIAKQHHINYHGGENAYFGWECGRINV
jgi:hypothetical protein